MSDAPMGEAQGKTNAREKMLVFQRCPDSLHAISWKYQFVSQMARKTNTAELFIAVDTVEKISYINNLLGEITNA